VDIDTEYVKFMGKNTLKRCSRICVKASSRVVPISAEDVRH